MSNIGIVAANNHYGAFGPGTIDVFREMTELDPLSFENVDIAKINRDMELETRFTLSDRNQRKKGKETSISDFVN